MRAHVRLLILLTMCVCVSEYVCVCVYKQEEQSAQGKTVLCVDIDCVMCADFRDLSI